jgi:DNA-binding beta-propeller fold protein YncE
MSRTNRPTTLAAARSARRLWPAAAAAVLAAATLVACGGSDDPGPEPTPVSLTLAKIGGYADATLANPVGAAEITAFDPASKRLFVVNSVIGTVDVLDLTNPASPRKIGTIDITALGASVNSVAVSDGLVALAIEAAPKTNPGVVAFFNAASLARLGQVTVGALPDMLTFTPDGRTVLVANEGEPNSYGAVDSVDPEGSISLIAVNRTGTGSALAVAPTARTAGFAAFNGQLDALRAAGVRIYGPRATVAQDLEPEYITVSTDGATAWVTLQENNAIAVVDVATAAVTAIRPLGTKDFSVAGFGLDPSDEDGGTDTNTGTPLVRVGTWPVRGMYMPDAIASYTTGGVTYLLTANEGDARADWPGFNEEIRVRAYCTAGLDPAVFGADAARLLFDSSLGRLQITNSPNGNDTGKNASGQCNKLWAYGSRSLTIWRAGSATGNAAMERVWDSGEDFERRTQNLPNANFNASNANNTLDNRSPSKGPEPEAVVTATFGAKTYAFVALERVGGVMVYDITTPTAPTFVTYLNTRDGATGDRGPEGLAFIPAGQSPNGQPLLIVGNETSGSTAVLQVNLVF